MFVHPERLIQVLQLLNEHSEEIRNFYLSILHIQVQAEGIDKLKDTFRASVSERRGASFDRGEAAIQAFDDSIQQLYHQVNITIENNPAQAHSLLFESIVKLPNIDQKIAAMFIKFIVVYLNVWPEMLPYLYVPIDRVVLKILGERLQVYVGPWNQSPSIKNPSGNLYVRGNRLSAQYSRFIEFQNEIGLIAQQANVSRILVDELWFIGYIFCKEYPLCNRCWVREFCQTRPLN